MADDKVPAGFKRERIDLPIPRRPVDGMASLLDLGKEEFESTVRNVNQIMGKWAVEFEHARHAPTESNADLNMRGMYSRITGPDKSAIEKIYYPFDLKGTKAYIPAGHDQVWAIGPAGQDPRVYAHEFRHRAFKSFDIKPFWKNDEEATNRLLDAAYADTAKQWSGAVKMWQDQQLRFGFEMSMEEAEKNLLSILKSYEGDVIELEKEYITKSGKDIAIPTVGGWIGPKNVDDLNDLRDGDWPLPWRRWEAQYEERGKTVENLGQDWLGESDADTQAKQFKKFVEAFIEAANKIKDPTENAVQE